PDLPEVPRAERHSLSRCREPSGTGSPARLAGPTAGSLLLVSGHVTQDAIPKGEMIPISSLNGVARVPPSNIASESFLALVVQSLRHRPTYPTRAFPPATGVS